MFVGRYVEENWTAFRTKLQEAIDKHASCFKNRKMIPQWLA
jgi:hypothetical protein